MCICIVVFLLLVCFVLVCEEKIREWYFVDLQSMFFIGTTYAAEKKLAREDGFEPSQVEAVHGTQPLGMDA